MTLWNLPSQKTAQQTLRFTPYAWAKLLYLRDAGPTEVGAFGVSGPNDLLLVRDLHLIKQITSPVTVRFDDAAVADYLDAQVDQGLPPEQCARCWIHTHPGDSAQPSGIDEETFLRCFGGSDWAVMAILAKGGQNYARMRFRAGPGGQVELAVGIDWNMEFQASRHHEWQDEFFRLVEPEPLPSAPSLFMHRELNKGREAERDDGWPDDEMPHYSFWETYDDYYGF